MNRFRLLACGLMLILAACEQQAETPGGDNGTLTLPTTGSSVRVLKGEDFENGTVAVTLPDLGADERVAVIPVYAGQAGPFNAVNYTVGASGLRPALPGTVQIESTRPPAAAEERTRKRLELHEQSKARTAGLRRSGTATLKEKVRSQDLGDNCPAPYDVGSTTCDFWFYDVETDGEKLVDTTLRFESANAYWFVDDAYADEFTEAELERLAQIFEDDIAPVDTRYFGEFPDSDGNGKIFIVFSSLPFYGYVSYDDFFDDDEIYAETGFHSNEGDIFYAYLPSNNIEFGFDRERYFTVDLPSTLVHELKHLIAGGIRLGLPQEQFVGFEESWAEEASAVAAEELTGKYGNAATGYAQSAAADSLADPEDYFVVDNNPDEGPEGFSYYGYNFLLLWRIAEQVGHDTFWKTWTAGPETGIANVEKNASELGSFADMMADWAATLMFDHTGLVAGYDYKSLNLRDGSWQPLWYNAPLSAATGETRSLSYYVGYGKDEDADVTVRTSDATPYVVIARFTGDLPY